MMNTDTILAMINSKISEANRLIAAEATSTDDTPFVIEAIEVADNTGGILEVSVLGITQTDLISGKRIVRYKKIAGVLTLGTSYDLLPTEPDAALTGVVWGIAAVDDNIEVQATGIAATTINWLVEYKSLLLPAAVVNV